MNNNVPQIRFNGYSDAWEERKLEDISEIIDGDRGKNYPSGDDFKNNGHTLFLSAANVTKQGFVFKETQYITKLKSESLGSGKVILNDIILTSRGSIGHIGFYDKKTHEYIPQARINSGMLILRTDKLNSPSFIAQFLKSPWGIKQIKLISFGSAQPQLTKKDIKNFKIILPKMEEQQKIGSFFKQLDDTIALHQRKLDLLKEQKKGYLQKMFPKNSAKVPELRFAGFADDWEDRKFKDILKTHSFRSYLAGVSENGEYEVIQQGDKPIVGYSDGEPFTDYKDVTLFGDHTVSLYKPKSPFFVATDGVKILSADNFEGNYLHTTLERYKPEPQGYKRHFTILKNQDVWFTENMEEQQKIGSFFKQLDETIDLHQRKLDLLKEQKKGFLQKMFV